MACELLLEGLLDGSICQSVISNAFQNSAPIKAGSSTINLSQFIPFFLEYIRTKLSPTSSDGNTDILYHSPRQKQIKKPISTLSNGKRKDKRNICVSLNYSSSSPAKPVRSDFSTDFNDISPIKKVTNSSNKKTARRQKTTVLKTSSFENTSHSFELSSFEDFPSIGSSTGGKIKNPRRITATQVSRVQPSGKENSFLEESSFEVSSIENPEYNDIFSDSHRFTNGLRSDEINPFSSHIENNFGGPFDDAFSRLNIGTNMLSSKNNFQKGFIEKESMSPLSIKNQKAIDLLLFIYFLIFSRGVISNYAVEFHFLFAVLVYPPQTKISSPFDNVSGCVYFVCECLKRFKDVIRLLDIKTNMLLYDNDRIRLFMDPDTLKSIKNNCKKERQNISSHQLSIKSPMTGIPFQIEYDNRKSFQSDQLFYSFSKKRDLFYSLIRLWEENQHDPEWDMKFVLRKHIAEIIRSESSVKIFHPLARLFIAQLLQMCRTNFGFKTDEDENKTQNNKVISDLKSKNPSKFHSLENRFTKPSLVSDPCPKPTFSNEEYFFREFINMADSWMFNKSLLCVILQNIHTLNSQSFGLDDSFQLNRSDLGDSIWHEIKTVITDLRILGKFLGYILFLPFQNNEAENHLEIYNDCTLTECIDVSPYIRTAVLNNRLIVTVPWVVEFFSMANKNVFKHSLFEKPFVLLVNIYGRLKFQSQMFTLLHFSLLMNIGWLLEQYQVESIDFFKSVLEEQKDFDGHDNILGIDQMVDVDKTFLYELCPYLNDIKKPLIDYAKGINTSKPGTYRKITTLKTSDIVFTDPTTNIRLQLIDSFMRYLPSQTSDLLKFLTERHYSNMKNFFTSSIFPLCAQSAMEKIKSELRLDDIDRHEGVLNISNLQLENQTVFDKYYEESLATVLKECQNTLKKYLVENVESSVKSLLPCEKSEQLVETCVKVLKHNLRNKIQEWCQLNKGTYFTLVETSYQKHLKLLLKTRSDKERSIHFENII